MVILHVLLGAERGGCERCCEMVVRHLPDSVHRVLVLGHDGPMADAWREAGATVEVTGPVRRGDVRDRVRGHARSHPADAAVMWHGLPHLPQILAGLEGVVSAAAVYGGNSTHAMPHWVDWYYTLLGWRHPVKSYPTYICCSKYVADSLERSRYLRRFPRTVALNGVPLPPDGGVLLRDFSPGERFVVGMHARLDRIKDHATVLRAFAVLRQFCPLAELEFAGSGDNEATLQELAGSLGIQDAVRFLGGVGDVYSVLKTWDLYAYATTPAEGLGSAPAEALMVGLPSVMTDIGPIREVAGPHATTLLVPPYDPEAMAGALFKLAREPALRQELSTAARAWASVQFDPRTFARRYAEVLFPGRGVVA